MDHRFLKYLDEGDWEKLDASTERQRFAPDEVILAEGDRRHALFVIEQGAARVERRHAEFHLEIARLEAGEVFGEMSFVEGYSASASVVADEDCEVAVIEGDAVDRLIAADDRFAARFYRSLAEVLSQRLRRTTAEGVAEFSWGGRIVEGAGIGSDVAPLLQSINEPLERA